MVVDLLVMGFPGAIMFRLDALVRMLDPLIDPEYIDVECGGYVMRFNYSDVKDGIEHPWRLGVVRREIGFGSQIDSAPVERYNERGFS
jgi:hypothetical protein